MARLFLVTLNIEICQQNPVVLPFISVKPFWQNFCMVPFTLWDFAKRYFGILVDIFFGHYQEDIVAVTLQFY